MVRAISLVLPATLLFGGIPALSAQADFETTAIADGVHQFRWIGHNGMFVVTEGGVVAFDPIGEEAARAFGAEIRRIAPGQPLAAIVYSHSDADHATGAGALMEAMGQTDVPIIAHEDAVEPIRQRADRAQPLPTVTFAERMTFQVGDRSIELHYLGRGHTDNMIVPFIPDAGVAFAVDFVSNDRMGYQDLPGWYLPDFFDTLSNLLGIPFETIVFGHGPPGDRASVLRQIEYYDALRFAARDAVDRGWSEDRAAAEVRLDQYSGWDRYDDWFPMNVRAFHRWLSGANR